MDIEAARIALKEAVMASDRRMEWEEGRKRNGKSWRIKMRDNPTWVYVRVAQAGRTAVTWVNDHGEEKVTHCGNPTSAVALAERFSAGDFS